MLVSLIAAIAENRVIGRDNDLPWRIRDDMRFFKETTQRHPVIMGRRNFDAMGQPLPRRHNIVITRRTDFSPSGVTVVASIEDALRAAANQQEPTDEAFVIGGAQIYELAFPYAHRFYRTRVLAKVQGDVYFPEFDESEWHKRVLFEHERDERNEYPFVVELLERRSAPRKVPGT